MRKAFIALALALAFVILSAGSVPTPVAAAGAATCTANPSSVVVGTAIDIVCTGFDANVIVNSYIVDATGFAEWGDQDYAACLMNSFGQTGRSTKTDGSGRAHFIWYTQNGKNTCPLTNYSGYSNQLGAYTVVVQELDGIGGIKTKGTVKVNLKGNGLTAKGAQLSPVVKSVVVPGSIDFEGSGFTPGEPVSIWFTRPGNCSGMGYEYWTAVGAFDPSRWGNLSGVGGPSTVKADGTGAFTATYQFGDPGRSTMPCLGTWFATAHALGSGLGAETQFQVRGNSVRNNATVTTEESFVTSIGQMYDCGIGCGVAVHVHGSGFLPGSHVNCWFTRPDGTTYNGYPEQGHGTTSAAVDSSGKFGVLTLTFTSENGRQAEQPGRWAVTCGTPDKLYSGTAWFNVISFLDP
jgi:hypothetical protein